MNEQEQQDPALNPTLQDHIPANQDDNDDNDDDLVGAQVETVNGQEFIKVPKATIIGLRKGNRELKREVNALKPVAARTTDIETRLNQAQPIISAVLNNPKLRAEALRGMHGEQTQQIAEQVQEQVDQDAREHAEDHGWYLNDGVTPDVARAQRDLARYDRRSQKHSAEAVRPFAGLALNTQAETNLTRAMAMTDNQGVPLATQESIRETAKMLPQHLLANPQVVELVINNAIGLDRRNNRTPRAVEEPLYMDSQGGRINREPVISQEERDRIKQYGISEKDYIASTKRLEQAVTSRKAVTFE